jgi:septal ring factor EnvC (AmiA/AmiB activator)
MNSSLEKKRAKLLLEWKRLNKEAKALSEKSYKITKKMVVIEKNISDIDSALRQV